ncbi:hypothetical protein [Clostridium akagii]|uniref:hypothetical protein n=1 Tax=Clostridium akagii TaxID=91623 RepID=UPI00047A6076|nr:hypothetical protein [Clostridium akagii]
MLGEDRVTLVYNFILKVNLAGIKDIWTQEKISLTNLQAEQILTFVDSINEVQPLQARMRKYLSAAANVVFATGENSLKQVVKCLEDHVTRTFYISKLLDEEKQYLEDKIKLLQDLDEYSKTTKNN